jgi:hypothetical protein
VGSLAKRDDDEIASVEELLRFACKTNPQIVQFGEPGCYSIEAAMHGRLGNVLAFPPLDVGIARAEGSGHVASVPCFICPPDDLHVLLRHRLPPLLGEPFGGCAGLVDVGGRKASDRAPHTEVDPSLALSDTAVAANRTPVLTHHSKHNPTAEVFFASTDPRVKIVPDPAPTPLTPSAQRYLEGELRWQAHLRRKARANSHRTDRSGRRDLARVRDRRDIRTAKLFRTTASIEGEEPAPRYTPAQLAALANRGLAYKCRNGAYVAVVDRRDLLNALGLWPDVPDSDRLPLKAFIKKRAILLRLETLLPASWQLKVPPLKPGEEP